MKDYPKNFYWADGRNKLTSKKSPWRIKCYSGIIPSELYLYILKDYSSSYNIHSIATSLKDIKIF